MKTPRVKRLLLLSILYGAPVLVVCWYGFHRYLNSRLLAAIENHSLADVQRLLAFGADPNYRVSSPVRPDAPKTPILDLALGRGTEDIAIQLIRAGARTEMSPQINRTFAQSVVDRGLPKLARELLDRDPSAVKGIRLPSSYMEKEVTREMYQLFRERGAKISIGDAIRFDDLPLAMQLIASGADPNEVVSYTSPVLHVACFSGDLDLIQALIHAGARIDGQDQQGQTALMAVAGAYAGKRMDVARLLIDRAASVNAQDKQGYTVLMHAAMAGNVEMVRLLLDHGADPSKRARVKDQNGVEHLTTAASVVRFDGRAVYDLLKSRGAKITLSDALHNNDEPLVLQKLKAGENVNERDGMGTPALARLTSNRVMLEQFLKAGARIDERDYAGWTPLMHCIMNDHADTGEWLIEHGADLYVRDRQGKPVLDWFGHFPKYRKIVDRLKAFEAANREKSRGHASNSLTHA